MEVSLLDGFVVCFSRYYRLFSSLVFGDIRSRFLGCCK